MKHQNTGTPVVQQSTFYSSTGKSLGEKAASDNRILISFGSVTALVGFILSGPVSFVLVQLVKPQHAWTSAANFAAQYNSLQNIPYFFGFLLVGGMLILTVAHYLNIDNELPLVKMHILLSVIWTTIFAALAFFNYICQTTYIHHLASHYKPDYDTSIATLSMANPVSLSWAVEMWSYAILGIGTWLLSAYYKEKNKAIYFLLITNGIISVLSAAFFVYDGKWLLTTAGLTAYGFWNFLMIALLILIYRDSKKENNETQ